MVVLVTILRAVMVEEEKTMIPPPPFGVMSELVEVANLELPPEPPPQPVQEPTVREPMVALLEKRFVVEAKPET